MTEDQLLDFIARLFRSVWPLELLTVLYRNADQTWSIHALAREIRGNATVVNKGLQVLEAAGLVAADEGETFRFQPRSAELANLGSQLIDLYTRKPRTVMRAIFSNPNDKMQIFSNAFLIRKDPC